jgi:hypothetical protein
MATESRELFDAMQEGKPLARFRKTILGKVHVVILNPFTQNPEGIILSGNPQRIEEWPDMVVELWSPKEKVFFERMNKKHIDAGRVIEIKDVPQAPPSPNKISDEQIDKLLNSKFLALKNRLDKFTDEAPIFRILNRARELDKSEKIIKHIEEKLSELQLARYGVVKPQEEVEK